MLSQNLIHGDALTMRASDGQPIIFAEWGYLGKGKFQRRDFRLDVLTGASAYSQEGDLFAHLGKVVEAAERDVPIPGCGQLRHVNVEARRCEAQVCIG